MWRVKFQIDNDIATFREFPTLELALQYLVSIVDRAVRAERIILERVQ